MPLSFESYDDAWRYNLDTYAQRVSLGRWKPYRWQVYLSRLLIEAVLAGKKRIVVTAPPRHGKSEMIALWLPTWFLDMFPEKKVLLGSYGADLADDWSEKVRDNFDGSNPHTWTRLNPKHRNRDDWRTAQGGGMHSAGVGGSITGFGGDLVVITDPHKDWFEAQSTTQLKRVKDWFTGTIYHRFEPGATCIVEQTRWVEGDLAGYLINEHSDDWVEIKLPAFAEENDPLGREVGEALCPERFDEEALQQIKKSNERVFAALFQQAPTSQEGKTLKREWIQYYGGPTGIELPKKLKQFMSWDLNAGDVTEKGSFNVGQVWGDSGGAFWLLDQVRGRWEFTDTKDEFIKLVERWPRARAKYVEKKAAGASLISDLKRTIKGITPVNPTGSKTVRLESVAPYFKAGDVWLPHPSIAPWVAEFVEEIVNLPGATNDDQGDTLSQALNECRGKKRLFMVTSQSGAA